MRYGEDSYENFSDDFSVYGGDQYTPARSFAVMPPASSFAVMPPVETAEYSAPEMTPEFLAELQASAALMKQKIEAASDPNRNAAFDKYVADQAAKGIEVASTYTGGGGPLGSGGVLGVTDFAPAFDPASPGGTTGQVVRFDPQRMNAPVVFQPGQQYVLTDASGEDVIGRASSVEELQKLAAAKENMPYGFQLYRADEQGQYQPGTQLFGETDPRTKGFMGAFVNYGLPIVAGIASGGLSLIPAIAASAAASGAAKLMTGYTPEDAAKAAAIAGVTRGVLKGTGLEEGLGKFLSAKAPAVTSSAIPAGALSGAPMSLIPARVISSAIPASAFSGLASAAAAPVAGEILVQGARNAVSPALSSAISGGLGAASGSLLGDVGKSLAQPDQFQQAVDQGRLESRFGPAAEADEILALGQRVAPTIPGTNALAAATGSALTAPLSPLDLPAQAKQPAQPPGEQEIVVSGSTLPKVNLTGGLSAIAPSALPPTTTSPLDAGTQPGEEPELLAEADRIKRFEAEAAAAAAAGALPAAAASTVEPELLAEADRIKRFEAEAAAAAAAGAAAPTGALSAAESTLEPEALAEADRIKRFEAEAAAAAAAAGALPAAVAGDDLIQTVTGKRNDDINLGGLNLGLPIDMTLPGGDLVTDTGTPSGEKKTDLSKKIGAGVGVLTLLDQLLGGGGGGGGGAGINSAAGTRASLSPIFSAKLPEARGIFSPASFAPRDMSGTDFARYGYGPAQSFFENVPRNVEEYKAALAANSAPRPAPTGTGQPGLTVSSTGQPMPGVANPQFAGATTVTAAIRRLAPDATDEQIDAYLSGPEGARFLEIMNDSGITQRRARGGMMAAKGGASRGRDAYAVRGPGTGRSDEIPALLSDGEYVIDAETVAMLGDGSGEAGAKRLDELRVKIRKHKGRNLAKGKFSANAKRPDKYLSGGRV